MKINELEIVNDLSDARKHYRKHIDAVNNAGTIMIHINNRVAEDLGDDEAVRLAIKQALARRLIEIERDLTDRGVLLD